MTAPREDLESPDVERLFGLGWISGVLAVDVAIAGLGAVLCLRYPELLTVPEARGVYNVAMIRLAFFASLLTAFTLAIVSIVLRHQEGPGIYRDHAGADLDRRGLGRRPRRGSTSRPTSISTSIGSS